jgi:hypothetical protein
MITGFSTTLQNSCYFDPSTHFADIKRRLQMMGPAVVFSPRNESLGYRAARFALMFDVCLENIVFVVTLAVTVKRVLCAEARTPSYFGQRLQVPANDKASDEFMLFCRLDESRAAGAVIDSFHCVRFERIILAVCHVHIQHPGR